ncbi:hypothetical protein [Maribacter sp. 2307UL18-2]|uniref:hypothetical protein n=1 Tax=Maribacter sp. 2307UL18-2 TaxID=3386274 RepID=UPI0039BCF3EB
MEKLNYSNLDRQTQERLLTKSKLEIEQRFGKDLRAYAIENELDYSEILEEEAIRNLYTYKFVFKV